MTLLSHGHLSSPIPGPQSSNSAKVYLKIFEKVRFSSNRSDLGRVKFRLARQIPKCFQDIMWNYLNKTDRRIMAVALLLLLLMLYLLYNDELLLRQQDSSRLKSIGKISQFNRDVRQKISRQFTWKSVKSPRALHLGDSLFTGKNSVVKIELNDGRTLTLQENSLIVFNMTGNQLDLDLRAGKVSGTLDGCLKVSSASGSQDLCGQNAQVEVSKDGSLQLSGEKLAAEKESEKNQIQWTLAPEPVFYHFKSNFPLKLSWKATTGPSAPKFHRYRLQFSRQSDFKKVTFEELTRASEIETKGYPVKGQYFVRVQGEDVNSKSHGYSSVLKMDIREGQLPLFTTPKPLQRFSFQTNADGELIQPNQIEMRWQYLPKTNQFELEISQDSTFATSTRLEKLPGSQSSFVVKNLAVGEYFVRLRDAGLPTKSQKLWSAPVAFQVEIQSPANMSVPQLLTKKIQHEAPSSKPLVVQWTEVPEAHHYQVEASTTKDFEEITKYDSDSTEFNWTDIKQGNFYFRVRAVTVKGRAGEASDTGALAIRYKQPDLNPVESKTLLGKSPEDPGDPTDFEVSWTDMKGVESYQVEVSEDSEFHEPTVIESRTPSSVIQIPKPGEFHYRVRGMQKGSPVTAFSKPGKLNYNLKVPLATPNLTEPSDQMTLFFQKTSLPYIWLEWNPVRQAVSYQVEIAYDPEFQKMVFSAETKERRFLIRKQLPESVLYWRIRATGDDMRISNWSPPRSMSILSGRAPANNRPSTPRSK
jgi:hypothetical protein